MPGLNENTKLLLHGNTRIRPAYTHYKCNDNAGDTVVTDDGTGANDGTGNVNTSNYSVSGKINEAFELNGTTEFINVDVLATDVASDSVGTISLWFNTDSVGGSNVVFAFGDTDANSRFIIDLTTGSLLSISLRKAGINQWRSRNVTTLIASTWYHLVVVQDGISPKVFLNGSEVTNLIDTTDTTAWLGDITTIDNARIGCINFNSTGNTLFFDGKIDDVRYYQNVALTQAERNVLYNSGSGTEDEGGDNIKTAFAHMALEDNTDDGSGANAVTDIGTPTYTSGKLNNALTLDGSTDALNVDALQADLTLDVIGSVSLWVKFDAIGGARKMLSFGDTDAIEHLSFGITGGGNFQASSTVANVSKWVLRTLATFSTGIWYHYVVTHDGVAPKMYIDGVDVTRLITLVDTTVWHNDYSGLDNGRIGCNNLNSIGNGAFIDGQIDDFRYFRGVLSETEIAILYNEGSGTENRIFTDSAVVGTIHNPQSFNDAQIDTDIKKWGTSSFLFDGIGDVITIPDSADFDVFNSVITSRTVDFQVRHTDHVGTETYINHWEDNSNYWFIGHNHNSGIYILGVDGGADVFKISPFPPSVGEITDTDWHHIALVKVNDDIGVYLDGIQVKFAWQESALSLAGLLYIGDWGSGSIEFGGNIDEFRIQESNYFSASPNSFPSAPLFLDMEGTDEDTSITNDGYGGTVTFNGTAKLDDGVIKLNTTTSLLLDGNSDYLTVTDASGLDYDVADAVERWTIDLWAKHTDHVGTETYISQMEDANNGWRLEHVHGSGLRFIVRSGGVDIITTGFAGEITDTNWHHIALIRSETNYGVYLDGIQVSYVSDASNDNFVAGLSIGANFSPANYFDGRLEQVQITRQNKFKTIPNVGLTSSFSVPTEVLTQDTITEPTQEYSPIIRNQAIIT